MPDAKSLLPGRAFRSEHAQLRPEPHSIASHGPAPMDPLQTTRMRNGVLYAAEWPCCHDPLRFSLGYDDLLRARNNPQGLSRSSVAPSRRSPPLASPPSLTRSGAEPRGRERDCCPRQRAGHCADTPGSPRAATGRSRGPLRAECGLRSGRRERLSLLRAFHALLCVPKHTLRSSVASPVQLACHCHCPRRPLTVAAPI